MNRYIISNDGGVEFDDSAITPQEVVNRLNAYEGLTEFLKSEMTASEALYGFMGWLTSREAVTPELSAKHNAAIAAELVDEFCKANELRDPRDGWEKTLKHPSS